jgi:hypothetical protein
MSETNNNEFKLTQRKKMDRKLDTVSCGLFFIWIGIAVLANVGWGIGLIGVGVIIIGSLAVREYLSGPACSGTTGASC